MLQGMQRKMLSINRGFLSVTFYSCEGDRYWTITIKRTFFVGDIISERDEFVWSHPSYYDEEDERKNEEGLAAFKAKFGL